MEQNKKELLIQIRDYLYNNPCDKINLSEICKAIRCNLSKITHWAPTPDALIRQMLIFKDEELQEVLDFEKYESESAIDSMVISGQEIYERFDHISPAKYAFIQKMNEDLYLSHLAQMYDFIEMRLTNNIEKGIERGEYKRELNKSEVIEKYMARIKTLHRPDHLKSEHFTFANIFSNIFEDYLEEVATEENWHYFRKRKQFYEAITFSNR